MISSTGCDGASLVMGLSPGEWSRCAGPGSCEGAELGALACADFALAGDAIGPGKSCAMAGSERIRAAPNSERSFACNTLLALGNLTSISSTHCFSDTV